MSNQVITHNIVETFKEKIQDRKENVLEERFNFSVQCLVFERKEPERVSIFVIKLEDNLICDECWNR